MGTNKKDVTRANIYKYDPSDLYVETTPGKPGYDPRVKLPLDEQMVQNVMARGVVKPILVRHNGKRIDVVDGRQRRAHAIEANKRLHAKGAPAMLVPVIFKDEDDATSFSIGRELNAYQFRDDIITQAEHADQLRTYNFSDAQIAASMNVTTTTIKNWAKLKLLSGPVIAAIKAGSISAHDAVQNLVEITREEQPAALVKLLSSAPAKRRNASKEKNGDSHKKISPMNRLRTLYRDEDAMGALTVREKAILDWIFEKTTGGDLLGHIPRLTPFIEKKAKPKSKGT
jgi:ParB family transcriptional regulator, chromosome partitioning protein